MTKALTIIALFFSTLAYGQVTEEVAYKSMNEPTIVNSITWRDIVGGFYISDGFGGSNFRLDSNMTFQKIDFSCMARFTVDSGSWTINNHNTVVLKSNKQTLRFEILKFDNFYFFILPTQRQKFVKDLQATRVKFRNAKPFAIDDKTYSVDYMIGHSLVKKYYAKEIKDITGS